MSESRAAADTAKAFTQGQHIAFTLLIPLLILLATHGVLEIPLLESQGTVIFLFFIWITSSQAILTLTRLHAVASWKVSAAMTVREFEVALGKRGFPRQPVHQLTSLFEFARYSREPMGLEQEADAVASLEALVEFCHSGREGQG